MKKILFICAGNVARSQMAEAFYNKFTDSTNATSAGVLDFTPKKYAHPIPEVIEVMKEEGIDVSQKKVKLVTPEMVLSADKVFILCPEEKVPDFVLKSSAITRWEIKDPFDSSTANFRIVRDQIKQKVRDLIQ